MSIKFKIILFVNLVFCASVLFLGYNSLRIERKQLEKTFVYNTSNTLKEIARIGKQALIMNNFSDLNNSLKLVKKLDASIYYIVVMDSNGRVLSHTDKNLLDKNIQTTKILGKLKDEIYIRKFVISKAEKRENILLQGYEDGLKIYEFSMVSTIKGNHVLTVKIGCLYDVILKNMNAVYSGLKKALLIKYLIVILLVFVVSILMTIFFMRYISMFSKALSLLGEGKFDTKIVLNRKDELGKLSVEFNKMAKKLKEIDYLKEDFVSNVTHELRSPLGAIESYLNYMIDIYYHSAS